MIRRIVIWLLTTVFLASASFAEAQQTGKVHRIGFLSRDLHPADSRAPLPHNLEAFRQGLRELGYIEEKNIIIEYRYADGRNERLPALAEELVRLKVEIIVADSFASAIAAKKMTTTIPIIMASGADPIEGHFGVRQTLSIFWSPSLPQAVAERFHSTTQLRFARQHLCQLS